MGTCGIHPEEKAIGTCIQCGKPICRVCWKSHGYFCSEKCKLKTQKEEKNLIPGKDATRLSEIDAKATQALRFITRKVIPAAVIIAAGIILFFCLSDAGDLVWEFRPPVDKALSSMAVSDARLFFGCDNGTVYSVKKKNGETAWEFTAEDKKLSHSFPVCIPPDTCIIWDTKHIYGLDIDTGRAKWTSSPAGTFHPNVIVEGKRIFYITHISENITEQRSSSVYDILAAGLYRPSRISTLFSDRTDTPAIHAVNTETGKTIWTVECSEKSEPVLFCTAGGLLYLIQSNYQGSDLKNELLAFETSAGKGKWKAELTGGSIAGMYPGKRDVIICTEQNLYSISAAGRKKWKASRHSSLLSKPVADNEIVIFKQTAEKLAAVNRNDGKVRWTIPVATLTGQPVLGDRYVYISTFIQEEGEGTGKHTFSPTGTSPDSPLSEDIPEAEKLIKDLSAGISMQIKLTPILKAVDKATGNTVWTEKNVGGNIFCAKDRLFAVQRSNTFSLIDQKIGTLTLIYALNKDNGDLLWKYEHKGYIDSIAADESHLFFTSHQDTSGITEMMSFTGKAKSKLGNSISCISIVW